MKQVIPGIWFWSWLSEEKGYNFNGAFIADSRSKVLMDPVRLSEEDKKWLGGQAPLDAIYLTNKDHERIAYDLRREWKTPIWIHEKDAEFLKEKPDRTFHDGQILLCGLEVIHLQNQKSPGECALYLKSRNTLILGDALIGNPPGSLNLLPASKYADLQKARESLKRLNGLSIQSLLLGDGDPILKGAFMALTRFFGEKTFATYQ